MNPQKIKSHSMHKRFHVSKNLKQEKWGLFSRLFNLSVSCDHLGDLVSGCCSFWLCWLDAQTHTHTHLVCWRSISIFLNLSWSPSECFRIVSIMLWSALSAWRRIVFQFMTKCAFVIFIHVQCKVAFHGKTFVAPISQTDIYYLNYCIFLKFG